jgi:hypothetical protein
MKKPSKAAGRPQKASEKTMRAVKITPTKRSAKAYVKGCCTIVSPGAPDRDVAGVTKAECDAIENAHPGSATHWVKGSCA